MTHCVNCGEALSGRARFCAACGAPAFQEETLVASEETRVAAPRPRAVQPQAIQPQPVRPLGEVASNSPLVTNDAGEKVVFIVRPTLMFVKLGYALAALVGVLLIVLVATLDRSNWVPITLLIPFALALLLIPAYYHLRRNMLRYTLTDAKIEIDEGFVSRTTRNIPLSKVQDVTVKATVLQRLLKFGNVVVDNSGSEGGVIVFRNIPDPRRHADLLLRELRRWR